MNTAKILEFKQNNDMNNLPAPLTPPDCDLSHFQDMPLNIPKLMGSSFLAQTLARNPEALGYAVILWMAAWHQVPAASLPNDDVELARLAGFGRFVDQWLKVRDDVLKGFELCSDGRLYHPYLAERANAAWDKSFQRIKAARSRWDKNTNKKQQDNDHQDASAMHEQSICIANAMQMHDESKVKESKRKNTPPLSPPTVGNNESPLSEIDIANLEKPMALQKSWMQDERIKQTFTDVLADYELKPTPTIWKFIAGGFVDYWTGLDPRSKKAKKIDWVATFRNWARKAANDNQWRWKKDGAATMQPESGKLTIPNFDLSDGGTQLQKWAMSQGFRSAKGAENGWAYLQAVKEWVAEKNGGVA